MAADPPPGFITVARAPFVNHVGPILEAVDNLPNRLTLGIRVEAVHTNTLGLMHGGMIATLVDSAMARCLVRASGRRVVTLKMTLEYLDAVRLGDWLEAEGVVNSRDSDVAVTECSVRVQGELRARGTGVFRLLRAA